MWARTADCRAPRGNGRPVCLWAPLHLRTGLVPAWNIENIENIESSKGNCSSLVFVLGASRLLDFSTGRLLDRAWSRIDAMGFAGGIGSAVGAPVRAELVRTLVHLSVWAQLGVVCREYLTRFFINGCDGSSWGPCCTFVPCVHPAGGLLLGHVLCRLCRLSRLSRYACM